MGEIRLVGFQKLLGLELVSDELLREERLTIAEISQPTWIYQVIYGRNAWHSTWVEIYDEENFQLELVAAKESVEARRVQGSKWTIAELPALAFIGENRTLVVAEINTDRPLSDCGYSSACAPDLASIARAFAPARENSILRFLTVKNKFPKLVPELRVFRSISPGGTSSLIWDEHKRDWDVTSLKKHRRSFSKSMLRNAFLGFLTARSSVRNSAEITAMHKQSPLRAEGICVGDVVISLGRDGKPDRLTRLALLDVVPGQVLEMTVRRGDQEFKVRHKVKSFAEVLR